MSKTPSCPEPLLPFLYRWSRTHVDLVSADTLPELGVDLLTAGFDSPEVVSLAVCDSTDDTDELQRAARRAFASLGVESDAPDFHEVVVGNSAAQQIADGSVDPEDGLAEMVRLCRITRYSKLFEDWTLLGEAIYLFRDGCGGIEPFLDLTEETIPDTIRTLARQFLEKHAIQCPPG